MVPTAPLDGGRAPIAPLAGRFSTARPKCGRFPAHPQSPAQGPACKENYVFLIYRSLPHFLNTVGTLPLSPPSGRVIFLKIICSVVYF